MAIVSTGNGGLCKAITKAGQPCQGYTLLDSEYCFMHSPSREKDRAAARAKGGRARHSRSITSVASDVSLRTPEDVLDVVRQAVNDALSLENSISRARTLGYLAGVAIKVFEITDIEKRLSALEQAE